MRIVTTLLLSLFSLRSYGQNVTSVTAPSPVQDNAALTQMYNTDQKAREGDHIDWAKLGKDDEQRRKIYARCWPLVRCGPALTTTMQR